MAPTAVPRGVQGTERHPFHARSESENGIVVEWSGFSDGYKPGEPATVEVGFINGTDQSWRGRYCIQLVDRVSLVSGTRRNPLVDGAYESRPELSEAFIQKIRDTLASLDSGGYDPILCAQDVPQSFGIPEMSMSSPDQASVVIETSFTDHSFTVDLELIDGQWKIIDVVCSSDREGLAGVVRVTEEDIVTR